MLLVVPTRPVGVAATLDPATYVMELRALILQDLSWSGVAPGSLVVAVALAAMVALNVRLLRTYD